MKVSLFIPCIVDQLLPDTGEATVKLLRRLGCRLDYHEKQTCCGRMAFSAGFRDEARRLARHFITLFEKDEIIVSPGGACLDMVRSGYVDLFRDDRNWAGRAEALSRKAYELSEFIVDVLKVTDVGAAFNGKVAYHESCSLKNKLGISTQPQALIRAVKGIEMVPMNHADTCCGFGGRFANDYGDISEALVSAKVNAYLASGADVLLLGEPGCLLNIRGYVSRHHPGRAVMHIANFLADHL